MKLTLNICPRALAIKSLQMQEIRASFWVFLQEIRQLESTAIFPLEHLKMVVLEGFTNLMGIVDKVKCYVFPKGNPVKVCCTSGISWAFSP